MSGYALMWSGGKDSALALRRARASGLDVRLLLNFYDSATGRVRFHATRKEMITAQAAAMGVELHQLGTSWEAFLTALDVELANLRGSGFAGVVFGDIHLADVRSWYENRVLAAGLDHVEPIWGDASKSLLDEYVAGGGRAVITCCQLSKLGDSYLGRVIDDQFAADVAKLDIDACGENGEYHSFAYAGPEFKHEVGWVRGHTRTGEEGFAQLDVLPDRCSVCGRAVDRHDYVLCHICREGAFCIDCASKHLCTRDCADRGCLAGLCTKRVRDGSCRVGGTK